tara:strand:+ start:825 stop:2270 length:1446 start_codon:yes stop_codon:yes gene_type:complete
MNRIKRLTPLAWILLILVACSATEKEVPKDKDTRQWLSGDHHIHSQYSVGWDREKTPWEPIIAGDAIYPIPTNAMMAKQFGLSWMVTTDHGGPNHSKINLEMAYPELLQSRSEVSEVIQFYGMELDTPAGDHSSLIIPHTHDEADILHKLELGFDKWEVFPADPGRDTEDKMIEALSVMRALDSPPVVIANHPSRSAKAYGEYGLYHPAEFRRWNDTAPDVAVGMAGAPGHQAFALANSPGIKSDDMRIRGGYRGYPTLGGFDQMTARVGGFWDSMLGEGRRWWITANSDSHQHYDEGGVDFWPGEYSKTYVYADRNHDSILSNLRAGHVFVTTGHLIDQLYVEVTNANVSASIGDEITVPVGSDVTITIRLRDPTSPNPAGYDPSVNRVDLIMGDVTGISDDPSINSNSSTRVIKRFNSLDWKNEGEFITMSEVINVERQHYVRVRGTNTDELEPTEDPAAENPWHDLWFYSNPVFIKTE